MSVIGTLSLWKTAVINDRSGENFVGTIIDVFVAATMVQDGRGHVAFVAALHYTVHNSATGVLRIVLAADPALKIPDSSIKSNVRSLPIQGD